ncbi:MAG: hypothetical protein K2N82_00765, partial [Lachnospiraceae bacterium]|nr:hypothetical protein [Lachnospiraceae bacterium]
SLDQMLANQIAGRTKSLEAARMAGSLSDAQRRKGKRMIRFLETQKKELALAGISDGEQGFIRIKGAFAEHTVKAEREDSSDKESHRKSVPVCGGGICRGE